MHAMMWCISRFFGFEHRIFAVATNHRGCYLSASQIRTHFSWLVSNGFSFHFVDGENISFASIPGSQWLRSHRIDAVEKSSRTRFHILTTKNSSLSTRWLPSVSNMLNAILKPDFGSAKENRKKCNCSQSMVRSNRDTYLSVSKAGRDILCTKWFLQKKFKIKFRIWNVIAFAVAHLCPLNYETFSKIPSSMEVCHLWIYSRHRFAGYAASIVLEFNSVFLIVYRSPNQR